MKRLHVVDSHTGGEPTRIVVGGAPDLGQGSMAERLAILRDEHDWLRTSLILEPRGSDVMVGALLCEPCDPSNTAGVIFFNNVGYLHMCGHGTIGLITTLAFLEKIQPGTHAIETSVGVITAHLHEDGRVSVKNVPSRRSAKAQPLAVPGFGTVHADIAWGGNWFLLINDHGLEISRSNITELTDFSVRARQAATVAGWRGDDGGEIDHVELFAPPQPGIAADSQNFVLCPGSAYDRSPCGTGTSAKLACLHADGKLAPGQIFRQAGILGSIFEGTIEIENGHLIPTITGRAHVNAELEIIIHPSDPFAHGIRP